MERHEWVVDPVRLLKIMRLEREEKKKQEGTEIMNLFLGKTQ